MFYLRCLFKIFGKWIFFKLTDVVKSIHHPRWQHFKFVSRLKVISENSGNVIYCFIKWWKPRFLISKRVFHSFLLTYSEFVTFYIRLNFWYQNYMFGDEAVDRNKAPLNKQRTKQKQTNKQHNINNQKQNKQTKTDNHSNNLSSDRSIGCKLRWPWKELFNFINHKLSYIIVLKPYFTTCMYFDKYERR